MVVEGPDQVLPVRLPLDVVQWVGHEPVWVWRVRPWVGERAGHRVGNVRSVVWGRGKGSIGEMMRGGVGSYSSSGRGGHTPYSSLGRGRALTPGLLPGRGGTRGLHPRARLQGYQAAATYRPGIPATGPVDANLTKSGVYQCYISLIYLPLKSNTR